jgi:NagD protein
MHKSIICDIDGVLLHDNNPLPGAIEFVERLRTAGRKFVLLTNYPSQTAQDLAHRMNEAGFRVSAENFYTSAMATADFLQNQVAKERKAFVIGEGALIHELYQIGFTLTDVNPDFVILGETWTYNLDMIQKAVTLIKAGARFIATNPDIAGPSNRPACGALAAPIERMTGRKPFFIGKPNPYIIRAALRHLKDHSEQTVFIGDNMDTDVLAGVQAGMETILVLTGVSSEQDLAKYPYRPTRVYKSVAEITEV